MGPYVPRRVIFPVAERRAWAEIRPAVPYVAARGTSMANTPKVDVTTTIKERLGEVFEEIFAQGRQAGREEGYKAGLAEGARRERERILAATGAPAEGEAPAAEPAQSDGTEGAPAGGTATATISKIKKVLVAETAKATGHISKVIAEKARQPLPAAVEAEAVQAVQAVEPGLPLDERCKAEWDREPGVRAEFGTLEAYKAFVRQREAGVGP
jgi:hypothetical protein